MLTLTRLVDPPAIPILNRRERDQDFAIASPVSAAKTDSALPLCHVVSWYEALHLENHHRPLALFMTVILWPRLICATPVLKLLLQNG